MPTQLLKLIKSCRRQSEDRRKKGTMKHISQVALRVLFK